MAKASNISHEFKVERIRILSKSELRSGVGMWKKTVTEWIIISPVVPVPQNRSNVSEWKSSRVLSDQSFLKVSNRLIL